MTGIEIPEAAYDFLNRILDTEDYEIIRLAGDASNRLYYRVVFDSQTFVLMCWEPFKDDGSYPFLSVLRHFDKHTVGVPAVKAKWPEAGMILLEDLGDLTLERKFWENQDQELALPFYRQAIDQLVKIHYPASEDKDPQCTAFQVEFDQSKLKWEMNYGREHLLENMIGLELSKTESQALDKIFDNICHHLANKPQVICHRDYHSRNLMIHLGKIRVIDFQDARLGPVQYDLVSLIHDSYVELNPEMQAAILEDYFNKANEFKDAPINESSFQQTFQLQMVQRCFKAAGSFASFYNQRGDRRYLKYISNTLDKVVSALQGFPEYKEFASLILKNGILKKDFEAL